MIITSVNNDLVKETAKLQQRKYRDDSGLFLLEGEKSIEEALQSGIEIERIFLQEGLQQYSCVENIETTEAVLSKISTTNTPPKVVAVAKQKKSEWSNNFSKIILLEGIKDAGNLGTILRTSAAFCADAIILYGNTVDLYNPKCVRSSVGNLWKVPVFEIKSFEALKNITKGFTAIATLPKSDETIWLKDYVAEGKILVMFGCEATGLSDELRQYAKKNVTIEMSDKVESLNLSISVGILLYRLMYL